MTVDLGAKVVDLEEGALKARPNTAVPERLLSPDMILICGEDRREILGALSQVIVEEPEPDYHEYRSYRFWRYGQFTLAQSGIGSGDLEPFVHEVLSTGVVQRIVLVGTAGYLGDDPTAHGKVYLVDEAYTAGSAVILEDQYLPLGPRFTGIEKLTDVPRGTAISTDYFYGFSKRDTPRVQAALAADANLRKGVEEHWQLGRLIQMETGQFYHFVKIYDLTGRVQFVSFRGVANLSDRWDLQNQLSRQALAETIRQAIRLLSQAETVV